MTTTSDVDVGGGRAPPAPGGPSHTPDPIAAADAAAAPAIARSALSPAHEQRLCGLAPVALPSISSLLAAIDDRDRQLRPSQQPQRHAYPQQSEALPRHKKSVSVDSSAFVHPSSIIMPPHSQAAAGTLHRHRHNLSSSGIISSVAGSHNPHQLHSPFTVPLPPQSPRLAAPFQNMSLHRKSHSIDSTTSNGSNFSPISSSSPSAPRNDNSAGLHRHSASLSSIDYALPASLPMHMQQPQVQLHLFPSHGNSAVAFASPQRRRIHHARTSSAPVYLNFPPAPQHNDANYPPEAANAAHNFHAQRFRHRTQLDRLQREQQLEQFRTQMQHQHGSQEQSIHQSNHHLVHNANGSDGFQCTPSASNLGKLNGYMDSPDTFPTAAAATQNNESTASINSQILPIHTHRPQHRSLSATRTSAIAGVTDVIFLLNANGNPIKRRLRANREQLHVLEEVFAQTNGTPSAQCKKDLARRLGMPHKSILYWFQNRRAQIARTQRSHADAVHGASGRSSSGDGVFDGNAMYPLEDGTMASSAREFPKGVEEERDEEEEDDGLDYPAVDVESAEGEQVGEAFQSSVYQPV